ncbi:MAG: YhgE/Pip family protein [Actinomycetales bacterium]
MNLERADHERRVTWVSLLGLVLVPVMLAGGFLWATWDASSRLDRVQAAVVNNDEAVTIEGQIVPLGRQLSGGLIDTEDDNFRWRLVDTEEADSGLASGRYVAVVTIPKNFSAAATSYAGPAEDAEQATISVQTSEQSAIVDAAVSAQITAVARSTLNTTLTETYLDNVYLGFNETKEQFAQVADGAEQLADGTSQLADGVGQASDGTAQLADGMSQLSDGGSALNGGTGELGSGADQLADGAGQLADGVGQYTAGVHQVSVGAQGLADGINQLEASLPAGADPAELAQLTQLRTAMTDLNTGAAGLSQGLQQYDAALPAIAGQVGPGVGAQGCAQFAGAPNEQELCAVFTAGAQAGADATAAAASQALNTPDPATGYSLLTGAQAQASAMAQVTPGVQGLIDQTLALPEQLNQLADGVGQLSAGADQLAAGAGQLDAGGVPLASGADQLASGSRALATGVGQYAGGVRQFTGGVSQAAAGTTALADGLSQLDDGTAELAGGTRTFADELRNGAGQIPTYDATQRERLTTVVANPVAGPDDGNDMLAYIPATSLLMILALWLGGLATYLVVAAVPASTLWSSRPSWQLVLRAMAPGLAIVSLQALALTTVAQLVLHLSTGRVFGLLALLLFGGAVFVGANHALVAWFGGIGRMVSIAVLILMAAGQISSAVPAFFDQVLPLTPLAPLLDGVRTVIWGEGSLAGPLALLTCWLIASLVASTTAVLRGRTISAGQLQLRYA